MLNEMYGLFFSQKTLLDMTVVRICLLAPLLQTLKVWYNWVQRFGLAPNKKPQGVKGPHETLCPPWRRRIIPLKQKNSCTYAHTNTQNVRSNLVQRLSQVKSLTHVQNPPPPHPPSMWYPVFLHPSSNHKSLDQISLCRPPPPPPKKTLKTSPNILLRDGVLSIKTTTKIKQSHAPQ